MSLARRTKRRNFAKTSKWRLVGVVRDVEGSSMQRCDMTERHGTTVAGGGPRCVISPSPLDLYIYALLQYQGFLCLASRNAQFGRMGDSLRRYIVVRVVFFFASDQRNQRCLSNVSGTAKISSVSRSACLCEHVHTARCSSLYMIFYLDRKGGVGTGVRGRGVISVGHTYMSQTSLSSLLNYPKNAY